VDPEDVRQTPRRVREGPLQHSHRPHASHPQRHDKGLILIFQVPDPLDPK